LSPVTPPQSDDSTPAGGPGADERPSPTDWPGADDGPPTDSRRIVQRGLWFEELEVGVVYAHRPGRTVTEADNVLFSTLTMNHQALHLDAVFSAEQAFGQRLMNSMFTLSVLVGLSVNQLTQGTLVANLGFSDVAFPKPLFHGDTLYGETTVVDKRASSSRPGEGVVTFAHVGRNQYGVVVARATRVMLVRMHPDHVPDGSAGGGAA
jgi:acyl dehydratase